MYELDFATHCAYDAIGLDEDMIMRLNPVTLKDYSGAILRLLRKQALPSCGQFINTIAEILKKDRRNVYKPYRTNHGIKPAMYRRSSIHSSRRLETSEACLQHGKKDHMIAFHKPCLSVKTLPNFVSMHVNYYNISANPRIAWNYPKIYPYEVEGNGWSQMDENYSNYTKSLLWSYHLYIY